MKGMKIVVIAFLVIGILMGIMFGGTVLTHATTEIIVDDTSSDFVKYGPSSYWHEAYIGYNGHMYWTYNAQSTVENYAKWFPPLTEAGNYKVYVYIPNNYASTTNACYTIYHNGVTDTRHVNQAIYSNQWIYLGTFYFSASGSEYVKLVDATGESYATKMVGFDAVKWVKEGSPPSPPTLISPGYSSSPGEEIDTLTPTFYWNAVSGADYYALYIRDMDSNTIIFDSEEDYGPIYGTSFALPSGYLNDGTHYRWNMRAHNDVGWSDYSDRLYFYVNIPQPPSPPTVETNPATDVTETSAILHGTITDDGGASIDERRFDWGTDPSCSDHWTNSVTVSGNSFSYHLTGLQPDTTYYFRAWARNSEGWGQGSVLSFTTQQNPPQYTITFYTNPPNVGSIVFNGVTYTNGQSGEYLSRTYSISANIPSGYKFKNWETSGGVSIADSTSSSATVIVNGDGSLMANFEELPYEGYNRQAAYNYAQKYWNKVCSDGYFFEGSYPPSYLGAESPVPSGGFDCAHFVSCCIGSEPHERGGGLDVPSRLINDPNCPGCYGEPGANKLVNWLINSGNAVYKDSIDELEIGDVICYDWDNNGYWDHVVLYLGDGKIAAHSVSYWGANWDIYKQNHPNCGYKFIHINFPSPSNQPPSVAITSPANGATVSGIISIQGTASDTNGTVQSVQIRIDSSGWIQATGTTSWSYLWDTTAVTNGQHTIYARSYDGTDYSGIDSITVNVINPVTAAPIIKAIEPSQPIACSGKQWLTIIGNGFVSSSEVTLSVGSETFSIPQNRIWFINSNKIEVLVGLTKGTWKVWVTNDDAQSNIYTFQVRDFSIEDGKKVAALAIKYWKNKDDAINMTAIAAAESCWNPNAAGDLWEKLSGENREYGKKFNCGGYCSWGLWQIFMSVHKDNILKNLGAPVNNPKETAKWLLNPANNVKAAYEVWKVQGFKAWSTYTNGKYETYLELAREAVQSILDLQEEINRNLQSQVSYPLYLLDSNSFQSAVATAWASFTSWITQTHLTEKYDELYQTGVDYDNLRFNALIKARDSLNRGDVQSAEKYLQNSYTFGKLSAMSFSAAAEVFENNLEAGEILANGIKNGCEASVEIGISVTNPVAGKAVDYIYIGVDYAVDRVLEGKEQAVKNAIVSTVVRTIFNEIKIKDLGSRTIADYTKNRIGKVTFPMLQKIFQNNEQIQFTISRIIKESGVEIEERTIEFLSSSIMGELENIILKQSSVKCPVELHVSDSQGRVTGLLNGEVKHEIPMSVYYNGTVTIFYPSDSYHYEVAGTGNGTYELTINSVEGENISTFAITNVPITTGIKHEYTIDWNNLSETGGGITRIEYNNANKSKQTLVLYSPTPSFICSSTNPAVNQKVSFDGSSSYDKDGSIVSYTWDFGDGNISYGKMVSHSYSRPGNYTVTLTVIDNDGIINTYSIEIKVKEKKGIPGFEVIVLTIAMTCVAIIYAKKRRVN